MTSKVKIKRAALEFILGVSRELHPREFTGMLRGSGNMVEEVLVIPASTFGEGFATTRFDMVPIDHTIVGSVHSHPGQSNEPSHTDLNYFSKKGSIHLIVKYPYESIDDVAAYDKQGRPLDISET